LSSCSSQSFLAVLNLLGFEVQVEPSYSSVAAVVPGANYHQKLKLLFVFLQPAKLFLAVFKLPGLDVQVDPSYSSVAPVTRSVDQHHQKLKLLFEFHNLLNFFLPYLNQEDCCPS
jgi:hypothetical protein